MCQAKIPTRIAFRAHNHLGDALGIAYALERICTDVGGHQIQVYGMRSLPEIIRCFSLKYVTTTEDDAEAIDGDYLYCQRRWELPWCQSLYDGFREAFFVPTGAPFTFSTYQHKQQNDFVYAQFDSRSVDRIPDCQVHKILAWFGEDKIRVIGGPDTGAYLGEKYIYSVGDLSKNISDLLACKLFVGSDSGMAHLAGILGVPSIMVAAHDDGNLLADYQIMKGYAKMLPVHKSFFNV